MILRRDCLAVYFRVRSKQSATFQHILTLNAGLCKNAPRGTGCVVECHEELKTLWAYRVVLGKSQLGLYVGYEPDRFAAFVTLPNPYRPAVAAANFPTNETQEF